MGALGLTCLVQAHPRVSGENAHSISNYGGHDGSSPRERGKPLAPAANVQTVRLIPA